MDRTSPEKHVEDVFGTSGEEFLAGAVTGSVDEVTLGAENDDGGVGLKDL